ncbi:hypothetical protein ACIBHX_51120 [Nonomuraea sp. NPDC050536]
MDFHERYAVTLTGELGEKAFMEAMARGRALTVRQATSWTLGVPAGG